jgi:hypothetical protein
MRKHIFQVGRLKEAGFLEPNSVEKSACAVCPTLKTNLKVISHYK